jgi:hypothetical protein
VHLDIGAPLVPWAQRRRHPRLQRGLEYEVGREGPVGRQVLGRRAWDRRARVWVWLVSALASGTLPSTCPRRIELATPSSVGGTGASPPPPGNQHDLTTPPPQTPISPPSSPPPRIGTAAAAWAAKKRAMLSRQRYNAFTRVDARAMARTESCSGRKRRVGQRPRVRVCRQRRSDERPHLPRATPRHFNLDGRRQVGAAGHVHVVSAVRVSLQGAYHRPPFEPALVATGRNRPQLYDLVALAAVARPSGVPGPPASPARCVAVRSCPRGC